MRKSLLAAVLAALMALTAIVVVPVGADFVYGDWKYVVDNDGNAEIKRYTGSDANVTVPDAITKFPVTSIGDMAFRGCNVKNVTIGGRVTSIGGSAFYMCGSLQSVTIPEGVTTIGNLAFNCCTSLTSVKIPESVTSIGEAAFSVCNSLAFIEVNAKNTEYKSIDGILYSKDGTKLIICPAGTAHISITVPQGVTKICDGAFACCNSLENVTILDGVTEIGSGAFSNCNSLKNAEIQNGVGKIADSMFLFCASLRSVSIPSSVTSIEFNAFYGCTSLESVNIPDSVIEIGSLAFYNCTSLTSVTIPDGVTSIGEGAFHGCDLMTTVNYGGSEEQWNKIVIEFGNEPLLNAKIIFNYSAPAPAPGDINGDGELNARDVVALLRLIVGFSDDDALPEAADYDGNGRVNARDVIAIIIVILAAQQ